jgi:regulator of cell morphogenesis and NO signaling
MAPTTQTVREFAPENPASMHVFEKYGTNYCCGGCNTLAKGCTIRNLDVGEVIASLEEAAETPAAAEEDWTIQPLQSLISHIIEKHHAYVNRELPRLAFLADKVVTRHGELQPELAVIEAKFTQLAEELTHHQEKEELVLFPYIARMERAVTAGTRIPHSPFSTAKNAISTMTQEHEVAGTLMREIRQLTHGFIPPIDACPTYFAFYEGLSDFEEDLHQHIHLENNILFPRAIALESA